MKKAVIFIFLLTCLAACGKQEKGGRGYSEAESEVLNVLRGKWESVDKHSPEKLSFSPYGEKKTMSGTVLGEEIINIFHGDAIRRFSYLGEQEVWYMYFNLDTEKKEIHLYGVGGDGKFSIAQTKQYDYEVIDNNTIRLHDKSLSLMHIYNYKRVE